MEILIVSAGASYPYFIKDKQANALLRVATPPVGGKVLSATCMCMCSGSPMHAHTGAYVFESEAPPNARLQYSYA